MQIPCLFVVDVMQINLIRDFRIYKSQSPLMFLDNSTVVLTVFDLILKYVFPCIRLLILMENKTNFRSLFR